jgi:SPP1 gp7 family putative phage head morphogenesis protein
MKDVVAESVQAQTSYRDLSAQIEHEFGVGRARARLIARDQTLKYNGQVTEQLHKDAGVTSYIWSTSRDERVRGTPGGKWPRGNHYELDGQRFSYSNPPVVDKKTGRRANPGYDFCCRCVSTPYTDDLLYGED